MAATVDCVSAGGLIQEVTVCQFNDAKFDQLKYISSCNNSTLVIVSPGSPHQGEKDRYH